MSGFRAWLRDLPPPIRWTLLSVVAVLLLVVVGSGVWSWRGRRESTAQQALGSVVMGGMIAVVILALLMVPVFFVVVQRAFSRTKEPEDEMVKSGEGDPDAIAGQRVTQ